MIKMIEDITVISAEEFAAYHEEMIFVDTECSFRNQPIAQVYLAIGDADDELPTMWQESNVYGGDVVTTYEEGVIHTFVSLDIRDQLDSGQFLFIKVIALGEALGPTPNPVEPA